MTETERERKINDFLARKFRELEIDEDEPLGRAAYSFGIRSTTT